MRGASRSKLDRPGCGEQRDSDYTQVRKLDLPTQPAPARKVYHRTAQHKCYVYWIITVLRSVCSFKLREACTVHRAISAYRIHYSIG